MPRCTAAARVLQDQNLVQLILAKLLHGVTIRLRETMVGKQWVLYGMHRKKLMLINTHFYLLLCSGSDVTFRIASLEVLPLVGNSCTIRSRGDLTTRQALDQLRCLRPASLSHGSLGNTFTSVEETDISCVLSSRVCSEGRTLNIHSLDGLLSLRGSASGDSASGEAEKRVFPPPTLRKIRIFGVGHVGLTNRAIADGMFRAVQQRNLHVMADMRGVTALEIESPLAVRVHRNELPGTLEFYFPQSTRDTDGKTVSEYQSITKVARFVLGMDASSHASVHPGSSPASAASRVSRWVQNIGNIYLGLLDFNSVKTLRLRAFACMGVPVSYTRAYMGLRDSAMVFHRSAAMNKDILRDCDIVKNLQHMHSAESGYYSGLAAVVNTVSRSKDLREVVYTNVRSDQLPLAKTALVPVWQQLMQTRHADGSFRGRLRVFVEVRWYRLKHGGAGSAGIQFDDGVEGIELLYDSHAQE